MAKSSFWSEFKDFAMKGNVIDMAVGVVIGGAFGKIVTSLVSDIIMPAGRRSLRRTQLYRLEVGHQQGCRGRRRSNQA